MFIMKVLDINKSASTMLPWKMKYFSRWCFMIFFELSMVINVLMSMLMLLDLNLTKRWEMSWWLLQCFLFFVVILECLLFFYDFLWFFLIETNVYVVFFVFKWLNFFAFLYYDSFLFLSLPWLICQDQFSCWCHCKMFLLDVGCVLSCHFCYLHVVWDRQRRVIGSFVCNVFFRF